MSKCKCLIVVAALLALSPGAVCADEGVVKVLTTLQGGHIGGTSGRGAEREGADIGSGTDVARYGVDLLERPALAGARGIGTVRVRGGVSSVSSRAAAGLQLIVNW